MRILVTGSEGNIGCELVPYLRSLSHDVLRVDIVSLHEDDYIQWDIKYPCSSSIIDSFKPEFVYHMAGFVSRVTCEKEAQLAIDTNVTGTNNVIQICKKYGASLINFSTSEVYGNTNEIMSEKLTPNPNNRYGISKYLAEQLVDYEIKNYGLSCVTVRPFMIYGGNEVIGNHRSAIIRFVSDLYAGRDIKVHSGSRRSWMHIDDAMVAFSRLLNTDFSLIKYNVINIGHPKVVKMSTVAKFIAHGLGIDNDLIKFKKLPDRMTLTKIPDLFFQENILKFTPSIDVWSGINRVIKRIKKEMYQ